MSQTNMAYIFNVDKLILLTFIAHFPVTYASSYLELPVTNTKICSLSGRKGKIKLDRQRESSIVRSIRSFDNWPGVYKFQCKFEVKDSDDERWVFAVIQKLKFRESEKGCIDYIEFRNISDARLQLCGDVGVLSNSGNKQPQYAFFGREKIEVIIHVASQKLLADEILDLEVVFTSAKKYCDPYSLSYVYCGNNFCISKEFANDSYVNCPFGDCRDEVQCTGFERPTYHHNMSTTVTVGAITTVLACFLVFFACIWMLRHYNKLCWSSDFSGQRDVRMTPVPPAPDTSNLEAAEAGSAVPMVQDSMPSAPPLDTNAEPKILHDKDLPPSYDSLFPTSSR